MQLRRPVLALAAFAALLGAAPAAQAATCASQGLAITPLQSPVFYVDVAQGYLGSYVGYRVQNTGGVPQDGLWLTLESFTGGVVGPAAGGPTTAPRPLDDLASGAATPAYAYLKGTGPTTADQAHDVVVSQGRPGSGGVEVCREHQVITDVEGVLKAAANKVTGAVRTGSPSLGGTFRVTVTGETGTMGAGQANDPGVVRFSPAVAADWPASSFRLVDVEHQLPASGSVFDDVLWRGGLDSLGNTPYTVAYTFRVVGPTATPTPLVPVQNIASGTQVKHTDPGTLAALAPIPVVTSEASMVVAAGAPGPYQPGDAVPLTATATNAGSGPIELDELLVTLPSGWTVQPGATLGGAPVADPFVSGSTARFVGPFTVPAGGTLPLALTATAGDSGAFVATGRLAGGVVDATTDPDDDVPAQLALVVAGSTPPPPDPDDEITSGTGTAPQATTVPVPAGGGITLLDGDGDPVTTWDRPGVGDFVLDPATGTITFTPEPAFTGTASVDVEVTDAFGQTAHATWTVTVAAPPAPTATDLASSGTGTAPQEVPVTVPLGATVTLLDAGGQPALQVVVPGQGTYAWDAVARVVRFTPLDGFTGTPAPVTYRVTDPYGQSADAVFQPAVLGTGGAAVPPVVGTPPDGEDAPPATGTPAAQVPAGPPSPAPRTCVSRRVQVLHWLVPRGSHLRRVVVRVGGRVVATLPGSARRAAVDLRGRGVETLAVTITGTTRAGRKLRTTRTYRTCTKRLTSAPLETLRLRP